MRHGYCQIPTAFGYRPRSSFSSQMHDSSNGYRISLQASRSSQGSPSLPKGITLELQDYIDHPGGRGREGGEERPSM